MKLIFAIVQDQDSNKVIKELSKNNFQITKLCSTGGFLKSGNTTLLVGTEDNRLDLAIELIKKNSRSRKQLIDSSMLPYGMECALPGYHNDLTPYGPSLSTGIDDLEVSYPIEVIVGGATIFVLNVERFAKL